MASSPKKSAAKANLFGKREPEDNLEIKPILKKHKEKSEEKETTEGFADSFQRVEFLETKSDPANSISVKETVEGLDETPDFVEEVVVRKKTLFVTNLSPQTEISDIINFFENVEGVVRVQLIVNQNGEHMGCGFVEFASVNEAEMALQNNNGEYLHDCKIVLDVAIKGATNFPPKYCIDHKVWYEDYHLRESLPVGEDATLPDFVENVALRKKTLFVANLSPQTKLPDIIDFLNYFGKIVSVRLIVNHEGKHVGYGFVEFASDTDARLVLQNKNGEYLHDHKIFLDLDVAINGATNFPPKYSLAEMLWYEDCLRRESYLIEEDETPPDFVEAAAVITKTLFVTKLSPQTKISDIINFFKDVGEVVHVRLIVGRLGKHVGFGFVEFASTNEAKKALKKKNGEYLHDQKIFLDVAKTTFPYPSRPKYCIDHKVWYEDYLRRESLLIGEDEEEETVEGLVEEVARRKKTLFVSKLAYRTEISDIIRFFKDVGEVCRVRLIVNHMGEHVGCGFVEFASVNEAKKALQKKNDERLCGRKIFLDVVEIAPYPLRPKYNLAEKLWYEDYLRREGPLIEEDDLETKPNLKKQKEKSEEKVMGVFCGKKITFSDDD